MQKLSVTQIVSKIEAEECFHAVASDYSFTIKIDTYTHYVCGAVHDGHQFRKELWDNCLHSEYERWYEEDPETKNMVQSHPIVIAGMDSRFEYDLNRAPETAIYTDAWGKQLWKQQLPEAMIAKSLAKHTNFYHVVHALIKKLEEKFGVCIVYDMHSYNWKRWTREVPTWNLGTSNLDTNRFGETIESWRNSLSKMQLPNHIKSTSKINDTFQGNGYFLKYITNNFKNTLVLATEIAKVYCDEYEQILYPEVVAAVEKELHSKLPEHAAAFYKKHR
ncbi:N-formylglutamate amidohydrolase [Lacinutrix sp. C3R15]|uniref:N-formylglutamate amidohydrolase n=1 Tax=Flavobacteriaceae TaxID=49546 RepID=UPI001C0A5082|nr:MULTISPECIES: N-formylglutamate amidohydrolase [Flavobacteriaceae]MBU2940201.1 N-formylglutamate amidohydrolase [Lacinutrix sp. C3R15]MDO6623518.1 N-formylglutamate amidohydrolase [Oceanihabitans sp. 1_MG-2023]